MYSDAEARGQLRIWRRELERGYAKLSCCYDNAKLQADIDEFVARRSDKGRMRAFKRIRTGIEASGAMLEGVRRTGPHPIAVWSMLNARPPVNMLADPDEGVITVNYVIAGALPDVMVGLSDGLWTLEITDHAAQRVMQRGGVANPAAIIRAAHHTLLRLRAEQVMPEMQGTSLKLDSGRQFLLRAGPGGFICSLRAGKDRSLQWGVTMHAYAPTWISDDQLFATQVILADDGEPGYRLGDAWLMPPPLRIIEDDEGTLYTSVWAPGLPETLAVPLGHA